MVCKDFQLVACLFLFLTASFIEEFLISKFSLLGCFFFFGL